MYCQEIYLQFGTKEYDNLNISVVICRVPKVSQDQEEKMGNAENLELMDNQDSVVNPDRMVNLDLKVHVDNLDLQDRRDLRDQEEKMDRMVNLVNVENLGLKDHRVQEENLVSKKKPMKSK